MTFVKQLGIVTTREAEVLALVVEGETDKAIARRLGLSTPTVSKHLANAYRKLDVPNRAAAAVAFIRAQQAGLL